MTTALGGRYAASLGLAAAALVLSGCGGSTPSADEASGQAATAVSAATSAPAASAPEVAPADAAVGPCDLLTVESIAAATGVTMPDGEPRSEPERQVEMCTWTSSDPIAIVVTAVTAVGAEEAFATNRDLSPAYFDGDAIEKPLPGADKAYVVESGDDAWVIGAIAKGRFVQVQTAGVGMTEAAAVELTAQVIDRLP